VNETTIDLDGLVVSNHEATFPKWRLTSLENWFSGASVRTELIERPQQDGAYRPGKSYRSAKLMQLQGIVEASSAVQAVTECWDELAALSPEGEDMLLSYTDVAGTRTMVVRVNGSPDVVPFQERKAKFKVPLVAWDPRKLGPLRTLPITIEGASVGGLVFPLFTAGAVGTGGLLAYANMVPGGTGSFTNNGTAPAYPVFTITGGSMPSGFEIADQTSGARLRYTDPLYSGQTLVIDSATLRVLGDGQNDMTNGLTTADPIVIRRGETRSYKFRSLGSYTGTPTATISMSDAWW